MVATKDQSLALFGIHSVFRAAPAADAALLVTDSVLTALFTGQIAWRPTWVMASVFIGKAVLHCPAVLDFGTFTAAVAALYSFCFCYTLILALVVLPWNQHRSGFAGAAVGVLCYVPARALVRASSPTTTPRTMLFTRAAEGCVKPSANGEMMSHSARTTLRQLHPR